MGVQKCFRQISHEGRNALFHKVAMTLKTKLAAKGHLSAASLKLCAHASLRKAIKASHGLCGSDLKLEWGTGTRCRDVLEFRAAFADYLEHDGEDVLIAALAAAAAAPSRCISHPNC